MGHVFVEHDAREHPRLVDRATRHFLHFGVLLYVDLFAAVLLNQDGLDCLEGQLAGEVTPGSDPLDSTHYSSEKLTYILPKIFVPMQLWIKLITSSSLLILIGKAMSLKIMSISSKA